MKRSAEKSIAFGACAVGFIGWPAGLIEGAEASAMDLHTSALSGLMRADEKLPQRAAKSASGNDEDLAKKLNNPVADLIRPPFQFN